MSEAQQPALALKAWIVGDSSEEWNEIRYATTREQARHRAALEFDGEYADMSARRRPEFDHLAPKGPTQEQLFNAGWWFECDCGRRASAGDGASDWIDGRAVCHECAISRHSPAAPSAGET